MNVERDSDGFLVDMTTWTPEVMQAMADEDGFELTEDRVKYILAAKAMFEENGTVPAIRTFAKHFGMDRKAKELYDIFESGPMKKIAKYGGATKPTGCV